MTEPAAREGATADGAPLPDLFRLTERALAAAEGLLGAAKRRVTAAVAPGGAVDSARLEARQFAAHGYAWMATYVAALGQMQRWAEHLNAAGRLRELEALMLQIAFGEYLNQLAGGIALSQGEIVRPRDLGLSSEDVHQFTSTPEATMLM